MNDVGRIGRRLIARSAHAGVSGGRRLGAAVLERRRPKLLGAAMRLAAPRVVARRPAVSVRLPAPPGMSDFAAAWLFGEGPAEGTPFATAAAAVPRGERPSFLPPAAGQAAVRRTAAPSSRGSQPQPGFETVGRATPPPAAGSRPRPVVEEIAPFRLSRTQAPPPASEPSDPPEQAVRSGAVPGRPEPVPPVPAAADEPPEAAEPPAAGMASAVAEASPSGPVAARAARPSPPSRPAPVRLRRAAASPPSAVRPRLARRAAAPLDPTPVPRPAPAAEPPAPARARPAPQRGLWRRLLGLGDPPGPVPPSEQPLPPTAAAVALSAPPEGRPARADGTPVRVARTRRERPDPSPAAAGLVVAPVGEHGPPERAHASAPDPAPDQPAAAFVTGAGDPPAPRVSTPSDQIAAPAPIARGHDASASAHTAIVARAAGARQAAAAVRPAVRAGRVSAPNRPAPAPVRVLARTTAPPPRREPQLATTPGAPVDARRMAAAAGVDVVEEGGLASVVFAPSAVVPGAGTVLARADAGSASTSAAAPVTAPPASGDAGHAASAGAGHAPAAPDMTEVYEHVVEQLRRELLVERERMGDLTGDLP